MSKLPELDRLNLAGDAWAMLITLRGSPGAYFDLIEQLREDTSVDLWQSIIRSLTELDQLEQGQPKRELLQNYVSRLLESPWRRLGWSEKSGESDNDRRLRPLVLKTLGFFGDQAVIDEAFRRFQDYLKDRTAIPVELRTAVL